MRTSHTRIRQLISDEKSKLTDEKIFSSTSYAAYLTDIAEVSADRYKRKIRVKTVWDETPGAFVAYTDNINININCANSITADYPTRELKSLSLIGFLGHELGHVIYTDFTVLNMFMQAVDNKTMYPSKPMDLEPDDQENFDKYIKVLDENDEKSNCIIKYILHSIANIIEDVFVEEQVCTDFPGRFKTGIRLNNVKLTEDSMSITDQIEKEIPNAAIFLNMILQYARIGEYNNPKGYKGELTDIFEDCIELIDDSVYQNDAKERYDCANRIFIKMWPYVEEWIEKINENPSLTPKELSEMLDKLSDKFGSGGGGLMGSAVPTGTTSGKKGRVKPDFSKRSEETEEARDVIEAEGGRIELIKTESLEDGTSGGESYDKSYTGSGYKKAADDIERLLTTVAEERADARYNCELEDELQSESDKINYGNAHKGTPVKINRMAEVPMEYREAYSRIAAPLLSISKRMQKQIMQKLKSESEGGRINGLMIGKRLNPRSFVNDDGKNFYNKKYPTDEAKLAVAVLNDESGSMSWADRVTSARAASIVLYDFCTTLGIPVAIYGHTETYRAIPTVELYSYAEFDRVDRNDKYRLMDMSARSNNRDGAALRFVAERLAKRPEKMKILIIISDGQPAASGYGGTAAEADLRGIKQEFKNKGVTIFAAAIGDDKQEIERIYKEGFLDITDINKLPMNLTKLVLKYLKN